MVEREIDAVIHDLEHRLEHQNMDIDLYLKTRNMDKAALREEVKPVAESRIKRALFLVEFGKTTISRLHRMSWKKKLYLP